jgi:hypothetical protein
MTPLPASENVGTGGDVVRPTNATLHKRVEARHLAKFRQLRARRCQAAKISKSRASFPSSDLLPAPPPPRTTTTSSFLRAPPCLLSPPASSPRHYLLASLPPPPRLPPPRTTTSSRRRLLLFARVTVPPLPSGLLPTPPACLLPACARA